jgi:hypothetical protein
MRRTDVNQPNGALLAPPMSRLPFRGLRGPIATYSAAHGVSRSTAWRRLKAS